MSVSFSSVARVTIQLFRGGRGGERRGICFHDQKQEEQVLPFWGPIRSERDSEDSNWVLKSDRAERGLRLVRRLHFGDATEDVRVVQDEAVASFPPRW